jgi:hypothetical protein
LNVSINLSEFIRMLMKNGLLLNEPYEYFCCFGEFRR